MKAILLEDATTEELRKHYNFSYNMQQEFDDARPIFYFTHGTFNQDPMIENYRIFLKDKGITTIAISDNNRAMHRGNR